jgi:antitoxin (DNA-binding transcriptional repressor) of toxin-antitoxin stability system
MASVKAAVVAGHAVRTAASSESGKEMTMPTVTIEEAQARLPNLIEQLSPGEEILITRDHKPVARLIAAGSCDRPKPQLGTLKGTVRYIAPDFDAPLEDFKDYME